MKLHQLDLAQYAKAEKAVRDVLEYFKQNGLTFYELEGPLVKETSQGAQKYVFITVSIKLQ